MKEEEMYSELDNIELGKTREQFLGDFPAMADWVEKMEGWFGAFKKVGSLQLTEGRTIILVRFEKVWHVNLYNDANPEADKDFHCNLSNESLCALFGMWQLMRSKTEDDWSSMVAQLQKADG